MLAVEPHSMSTVPLATSGMRFAEVTGLYLIARPGVPSFAFTASTTCLHNSIEKPTGCKSSPRYDKGSELSRWPIVKVPVSFTFFSVPSRSCVLAGADAPMSKQAIAVSAIAFLMTLLPVTRVPPVSCDGGGRGVDCLSETFDGCVDLRGVNDERRRNQNMVTPRAIHRAAHWIDHQPPRHRFAFDAGMHLQFRVERLFDAAIEHQLDAVKQAAPADIADIRMIAETLAQSARQVSTLLAHVGEQVVAINDLLHRQRCRASERMSHIGVAVLKGAGAVRNCGEDPWADQQRTDGSETTTHALGDRHQIRVYPFLLAGVQGARSAHSAHHFVENEQDAVAVADFAHVLEIARHRRD